MSELRRELLAENDALRADVEVQKRLVYDLRTEQTLWEATNTNLRHRNDRQEGDFKALAAAGREVADMCEAIGWRCHGYRLVGLQEALARPSVKAVLEEKSG